MPSAGGHVPTHTVAPASARALAMANPNPPSSATPATNARFPVRSMVSMMRRPLTFGKPAGESRGRARANGKNAFSMGRVHALLLLAWALVRSLLAPLLGTRRGLADFRRSYAPDRLPALTPEERELSPTLSGCIACGLCDAGEGAAIVRSRGTYAGVMDLMLAS